MSRVVTESTDCLPLRVVRSCAALRVVQEVVMDENWLYIGH